MENKSIDVEILESTSDYVKVKLPFLNVPVQMNHKFFQPRVEKGYFKIKNQNEVAQQTAF